MGYLKGWWNYYGTTESFNRLRPLAHWIRRHLRALIWKQWKFGTEVGRGIKNGKLGDLIKNPTYGGVTPTFWRGCDAVGNREDWRLFGFNCAKGEPLPVSIYLSAFTLPAVRIAEFPLRVAD